MPVEAAPSFLWVEEIPARGERLVPGAEDAHYLTRVCRARAGEQVTLTDGRGTRARAVLIDAGRRPVVEVLEVERLAASRSALLLCGAPERGRADWMIEKVAELGVAALQPVHCERAAWPPAEVRVTRWHRLAVAALRQSRSCFLLDVRAPVPLAEAIGSLPAHAALYVADPDGEAGAMVTPPSSGVAVGLVGPAPGLAESEVGWASAAGFLPICLSDNRLRSETAALAWSGWWACGSPGVGRK